MSSPQSGVCVIGGGVVGRRVIKRLQLLGPQRQVIAIDGRATDLAATRRLDHIGVAVLTQPGSHYDTAMTLLGRGIAVVSIGDRVSDVAAMLGAREIADRCAVPFVVGAGMSPGLTGLIARHLATGLERVDEIHIAVHGTAGPECARQHHRALAGEATSVDGGEFVTSRAGVGRELAWFPEPVGAYDCYRAELPAPLTLHEVFPEASRITARLSANRRDRFTSRLPMLTPPHQEGGVGAVRVEVRGAVAGGARDTLIAGVAEMVGTAAAATAAAFAELASAGELPSGLVVPGDSRLDTVRVLHQIERFGVRLQEFTGVPSA